MRGFLEVWGSIVRLSVERDKVDERAKVFLRRTKKNVNNSEDKNNNSIENIKLASTHGHTV